MPGENVELEKDDSFDMEAGVDAVSDALGYSNDADGGDLSPDDPDATLTDPAATPAPPAEPAATPPAAPAGEPPAAPAPRDPAGRFTAEKAPDTWKPDEAAAWSTLPPVTRAAIARRENEMMAGIQQYKTGHEFGKGLAEALRPVAQDLQSTGTPPEKFVNNLVQAHVFLSSRNKTNDEKVQFIHAIAKANGITLDGMPVQSDAPYEDPAVKALREKTERLESTLHGMTQADVERKHQAVRENVEKYFADHPEALDLTDDIARHIRASGGTLPIGEAHEMAKWSNPQARQKQIDAELKSRQEAAARIESERIAKARKAKGATTRTSGHQGSGATAKGSMDDTIAETLAAMKTR